MADASALSFSVVRGSERIASSHSAELAADRLRGSFFLLLTGDHDQVALMVLVQDGEHNAVPAYDVEPITAMIYVGYNFVRPDQTESPGVNFFSAAGLISRLTAIWWNHDDP